MMNMQNNRQPCLRDRLKAVSFAVLETALYLDTHPDCAEALSHYDKLRCELEEVTEQYEKQYGPLTIFDNDGGYWNWINSPWPWESEAN